MRVQSVMDERLADKFRHLSQEEVARAYMTSDLWLYPTQFPETSCISAMKAQAAGALPVVSQAGALTEIVKFGKSIQSEKVYFSDTAQERFIIQVVSCLSEDNRAERLAVSAWALV